ncbi:hypothetical protein TIFTF001_043215 [Ficus carica]|uniref:Uncharacterized protein n=1 Tax=Ficus carica TaxID=3494 RepID=A0AA87ZAG6_FICCA|nr:hypothetical protein TIFTF001_043215 [Ficus carica]
MIQLASSLTWHTKAGHHEGKHLMLLVLMSNSPSFAPLASQGLHNSSPMTGHNKETTPHGLALHAPPHGSMAGHLWGLVSKHIVLLAWLARSSLVQHLMAGHHKGEAPHASSLDESTPSFAHLAI